MFVLRGLGGCVKHGLFVACLWQLLQKWFHILDLSFQQTGTCPYHTPYLRGFPEKSKEILSECTQLWYWTHHPLYNGICYQLKKNINKHFCTQAFIYTYVCAYTCVYTYMCVYIQHIYCMKNKFLFNLNIYIYIYAMWLDKIQFHSFSTTSSLSLLLLSPTNYI